MASPMSRAGMPSTKSASTDGPARTESTKKDGNTTTTSVTYGDQPVKKGNSLVTSADDLQRLYRNEDGTATEFAKNTIEPYEELSKKMAEGMTEPLGAGGKELEESLNAAVSGLIDNPQYETAGIGGVDESITGKKEETNETSVSGSTPSGKKAETVAEETVGTNPQETKRYTNSMMGIWDAFREGKIDQGTALYFTLDSIAKLARNTGKDLNNIAAAFTGGTINNEREDSLWGQRRGKMFENELASEVESQTGSPAYRAMQHDLNSLSMEQKNLIAKDIENYIAENGKNLTVGMLAKQLEAMGYANIASQFNTITQKEILDMVNSNDPAEAAIGRGLAAASHINVNANTNGISLGFH